jgi:hypothetical protein
MFKSAVCLTVIVVFCVAAGHPADTQAKELYRWTDENGVVHFTDTKPEGQEVQTQTIPQERVPLSENPYQQDSAATAPSLGEQRREEIARKNEETQANKTIYEAQCATWQAEVDRLEPNRRVFFTNDKGETERMDDVERTNQVAELKAQIARNCK